MHWYHSIELAPGCVTPGEYDLRPAARRVPVPSLEGARVLDVGTHDGFWAFEAERRGAEAVVAIDIDDPADFDWPGRQYDSTAALALIKRRRQAFELAKEAIGSSVQLQHRSVYKLSPRGTSAFDVAIVGTLLLHLRDPIAALRAIGLVAGSLVLNEPISPSLTLRHPRLPAAYLIARNGQPFWWVPNRAALVRYVEAAGWSPQRVGRPYLVPYGAGGRRPDFALSFRRGVPVLDELVLLRGSPHVWVVADRSR